MFHLFEARRLNKILFLQSNDSGNQLRLIIDQPPLATVGLDQPDNKQLIILGGRKEQSDLLKQYLEERLGIVVEYVTKKQNLWRLMKLDTIDMLLMEWDLADESRPCICPSIRCWIILCGRLCVSKADCSIKDTEVVSDVNPDNGCWITMTGGSWQRSVNQCWLDSDSDDAGSQRIHRL